MQRNNSAIIIITVLAVLATVFGILFLTSSGQNAQQIQDLNDSIAGRNRQIDALTADVAERESRIEELTADAADKAGQIKNPDSRRGEKSETD